MAVETAEDRPFRDRQFFRVLPLLVSYIKTEKKSSEEEILTFIRMFPEHRGYTSGSHSERMHDMT